MTVWTWIKNLWNKVTTTVKGWFVEAPKAPVAPVVPVAPVAPPVKPVAPPVPPKTPKPVKPKKPVNTVPENWVWTALDFAEYIDGPESFEDKRDFYEAIKEGGFNPIGVKMSFPEYRHWSAEAKDFTSDWISENNTPEPNPYLVK